MSFEWHTEEDGVWDVPPPRQPPPQPSKSKRIFFWGAMLLFALVAAGMVIYWQVTERLQQAETNVQTNILAAHNLWQTAVVTTDAELFLSVLSGRIPSWTDAQQEALDENVIFERAPWGLTLIDGSPPSWELADLEQPITLNLSTDLLEAELQFPLDYQFLTQSGVTTTVTLSQTAVYRQGARSWLFSPPDSEFWGDWQTYEGQRLTLIYPERDREIAERLAESLEQILAQICDHPDLPACAEDASYTIRFDLHPEGLLDAADVETLFGVEPYLNMPTPTLFGLPGDETAYEALLQTYAVPLGTAVFADLFDWTCCRQIDIFQMLVIYQLADMGITSWPITAQHHIQAMKDGNSFLNVPDFWRKNNPENYSEPIHFLYIAFDFIFQQYEGLSPVSLLSNFQNWEDINYWLDNNLLQTGYQLGSVQDLWRVIQDEWWHYAYTQTLLAQENEEPPIPLPDQDIALVCLSSPQFDLDTTMSLYRYNYQDDTKLQLLASNNFVSFNPFLNDSGMIIQNLAFDESEQWQTKIWNFEGVRTQMEGEDQIFFSLGQFDPSGRYAIALQENEGSLLKFMLIDLASCDENQCETITLMGFPIWSPDGERTLMTSDNVFESSSVTFQRNGRMVLFDVIQPPLAADFWIGDRLGRITDDQPEPVIIGTGYSPFWLDNETFGFIRQHPDTGEDEIVIWLAEGLETLITLAEVQDEVPREDLSLAHIRYVVTHPAWPDNLVVVALDPLGREAYVFLYDRVTGSLDLRLQSEIAPYHSLGFSPNGRWLVLTGFDHKQNVNSNVYIVHHIESNETQTYRSSLTGFMLSPLYDWSADGNWLSFLINDQVISMVAPEYKHQIVKVHGQGNCTSLAWINR
ncbi:MAG: hypothetical protein CSB13_05130 [Chloroflexi bacterium]|nr:MAG: hypothetical protein CSB13_05130 [Chloroflexota bacterium]